LAPEFVIKNNTGNCTGTLNLQTLVEADAKEDFSNPDDYCTFLLNLGSLVLQVMGKIGNAVPVFK